MRLRPDSLIVDESDMGNIWLDHVERNINVFNEKKGLIKKIKSTRDGVQMKIVLIFVIMK